MKFLIAVIQISLLEQYVEANYQITKVLENPKHQVAIVEVWLYFCI